MSSFPLTYIPIDLLYERKEKLKYEVIVIVELGAGSTDKEGAGGK